MIIILQLLLDGLLYGLLYALAASGLSLLYGVLEVVNFAHGEFIMLGAYMLFFFSSILGGTLVGIICALVMMALFGFVLNRAIFMPSVKISWKAPLLVTLGLSLTLKNTVLLLFGAKQRFIPSILTEMVIDVGAVRANALYLSVLGIVPAVFIFLHFFVSRTKTGKAMRAVSQNRELCDVLGMNTIKVFDITVAISLILAGIAGSFYGLNFVASPNMGTLLGLKVFSIVVLSGFKSVKGAIIVALMAGIIEALVAGYITANLKDLTVFVAAAIVAAVKPEGLFGKKAGLW